MDPKPPHSVALIACWIASFTIMVVVALVDAGLSAWLQGTIYLLAAILFALGLGRMLDFVYLKERSGYRQGICYIVAAWVFAGHAYYRIREHRADLAREESQLAPVVDAVRHFQDVQGKLPATVEELPDLPPHLPLFHYERRNDRSFVVSFRHDVFVAHDYESAAGGWHDVVKAP